MTLEHIIDITEVRIRSGLPASTLRYYEEIGLIKSVGRYGLRRLFHENVMEKLALISLGQQAGFSLEEISRMFTANGTAQIDRKKLISKAEELDQKIKQLTAIRNALRHAAECPAPSHLECPKFRRIMNVVFKTQKKQRN